MTYQALAEAVLERRTRGEKVLFIGLHPIDGKEVLDGLERDGRERAARFMGCLVEFDPEVKIGTVQITIEATCGEVEG